MFKRIGHKLILTFGGISTIGLAGLVFFYTNQQHDSLYHQNEEMMSKVTESVIEGLQTVMLAGYADIAQDYAGNLQNVADIADFRILRIDGNEAFLDSQTIDDVNQRKDEEFFEPREDELVRQILTPDNLELRSAVATRKTIQYYTKSETGENFLTFLAPIENKKACHECHGGSKPVRGLIKVTTSLSKVENAVEISRSQALEVSGIFLLIIISVTGFMVRRTIVQPITRVTTAMSSVSRGDLTMKVPVLGRDEISTMAKSFNRMSSELKLTYEGLKEERDKLSTLILSAHDGMVVTDRDGRVALTNPSAAEILDKSADQIFMDGFTHLFDDPQIMRLAIAKDEYIEIEHGGRVLQLLASTIQNQESEEIGSAALIRDVTTEKQLQAELRYFATTDSLTGLYNRRYLDEMLAKELERCQRYKHELSVIMFDVDHFKRFNDEHGHDQGDRVLETMGKVVKNLVRTLDVPCRYGGEEFLVILPETDIEGAMSLAERTRKTVANTEVDGLSVTISIGVAGYPHTMVENGQQFIEVADKALYQAKNDGRNCVRLGT